MAVVWNRVLQELGIKSSSSVLPCVVECPFCNGKLWIYADHVTGGEWYYCRGCKWAGDSIELAAKVWKTDEITAAFKLGATTDVTSAACITYPTYFTKYRNRLSEFWQKCRQGYPFEHSAIIRQILHKFGVTVPLDSDRWNSRMGRLIGGCSRFEAECAFQPNVKNKKQKGNAGRQRAFVGCNWRDLIVMPAFDLPGRNSGFMFIGREGSDKNGDFVFRRTSAPVWNRPNPAREPGLIFMDLMFDDVEPVDGTVFIIEDPQLAATLHANHFKDNSRPMPLLGSYKKAEESKMVWRSVPLAARRVHWGDLVIAERVFRQAKLSDGDVANFFNTKEFKAKIDRRPALEWLIDAKSKAKHWRYAFEEHISNMDDGAIEQAVVRMNFDRNEMHTFIKECRAEFRDRLERVFKKNKNKTIVFKDRTIVETDDGWVLDDTGENICNAVLRIDQVTHKESSDKVVYKGRILFKGEEIPFEEKDSKVDATTFGWMRKHLLRNGKGMLTYSDGWSKGAVNIAVKFHPPISFTEPNYVVGWNQSGNLFYFPRFLVTGDGKVETYNKPTTKIAAPPARELVPATLTPDEIIEIGEKGPENEIALALFLLLLTNVLAPAYGHPTTGIACFGQQARLCENVARCFGCNKFGMVVGTVSNYHIINRYLTEQNAHSFPLIIESVIRQRRASFASWVQAPCEKNCLCAFDSAAIDALLINGWHTLSSDTPLDSTATIGQLVPKMFVQYLLHLCSRRMILDKILPVWTDTVINDVIEWFAGTGGNTRSFESSLKRIGIPAHCAETSLGRTLTSMLIGGQLTFSHYSNLSKAPEKSILYINRDGHDPAIFLPKKHVNNFLYRSKAVPLDPAKVKVILQSANAWLGEIEYDGVTGWLIKEAWWDKQLTSTERELKECLPKQIAEE